MRNHRTSRLASLWRAGRLSAALLAAPATVLSLQGCTDLDENPTSAITPNNFYRNADEVIGGVASVYAQLRATMWGYYNLSQISTDENVVPTRGSDWFDNGRWLDLYRHTWTPTSGSGLEDISGVWNDLFGGVARANVVLGALESVDVPNKARVVAEMRGLRAFYYYLLMDFFGGVPVVTTTEIRPREQATRAEVFAFIETELNEARADLPDTWEASNYGRLTKGSVDAILANMYLNAQVFTGTVTPAGLTRGPARWQDAVTAADRVLNSGRYSLASNWRDNFTPTNENSPENIMVVRHSNAIPGIGMSFQMRGLHYNSFALSPWNGFATIATTYNAFDDADSRKNVFLVGPQVDLLTGQPIRDRAGNPLVFTPEIRDVTQAGEGEGARIYKYTVDPAAPDGGSHANDFVYFRLAEMIMVKAEALNELGQTAAAVPLVNQIRARAFTPARPLATNISQAALRDAIFNERLYEFIGEAKRRQDMIRAGTYTNARLFKAASNPYRILMPIPQNQIETNPLLRQNPGY
jgi:starch-binding outer membrane protein, SusD/RagB family